MSYLQAIVIAAVQGVTELFPVSSLGHSVIIPAWLGGSWQTLVTQSSQGNSESSFYLAFIVALHCATALALLWFFRADWRRIVMGFARSVRRSVGGREFSVRGSDERLAWMILIATIPVGLTGLVFEHWFRTLFAKPVAASAFLVVNGCILLAGERFCRRREASLRKAGEVWRAASLAKAARAGHAELPIAGGSVEADAANVPGLGRGRTARPAAGRGGRADDELAEAYASDLRISRFPYRDTLFVGLCQILALFAGISRDGVTMVGGLWRGLDREDAARFAFLLATPPILAAGILKLPSLAGHAGAHIHGQVVVGFVIAGVSAYVSVRFLVRYFRTHRSLTPFGVYCLIAGLASIIRFT